MELSNGTSQLKFHVDHLRATTRRLLTPLTNQTSDRPKLSAMIAPKDLSPSEPSANTTPTNNPGPAIKVDANFQIMIAMVEYLSGKSLSNYQQTLSANTPRALNQTTSLNVQLDIALTSAPDSISQEEQTATAQHRVEVRDAERLAFSLTTEVTTSDGRMYEVQLSETHQRQHRQTLNINAKEASRLIDPLVLNLEGSLQFSHDSTSFDLNSDGRQEQFRQLGHGSYFLALDLNKDGKINNGSELFGTQSGSGFADLRLYDEDGNGLIDKGDSIFDALRLFRTDNQELMALSEKQIVAIGLNAVDTPFTFTDSEGKALAQLRQSSFYLREDSAHGTVQHVDLAV